MTIAVIIPVLNEARIIGHTLAHTFGLGFDEIIVVDGGSADATLALVESLAPPRQSAIPPGQTSESCIFRLLSSAAGRARQLNRGAAASQCDVLLFLHADTRLPHNARQVICDALRDGTCVGGRFNVRFDSHRTVARLIGTLMNWRSRLSGIATGDQAIFVRRKSFEGIGGYAEIPLMEDIDFTRRLKRAGRVVPLTEPVITAFRRWEHKGPVRTILLMWTLRFLYWIGVSPHRLQQFYGTVR